MQDSDIQFLAEAAELSELTPPSLPSIDEVKETIRSQATVNRVFSSTPQTNVLTLKLSRLSSYIYFLRGIHGVSYFPPIRWAYERQQALALQLDLGALSQGNVYMEGGSYLDDWRDTRVIMFLHVKNFAQSVEQRLSNFR